MEWLYLNILGYMKCLLFSVGTKNVGREECYAVYISVYVCANELSLDQRAVMNMRYKCGYESYIGTILYIVRSGVFGELLYVI